MEVYSEILILSGLKDLLNKLIDLSNTALYFEHIIKIESLNDLECNAMGKKYLETTRSIFGVDKEIELLLVDYKAIISCFIIRY